MVNFKIKGTKLPELKADTVIRVNNYISNRDLKVIDYSDIGNTHKFKDLISFGTEVYKDEVWILAKEQGMLDIGNIKIKILSPQHSAEVQQALFCLGIRWWGEDKPIVEKTHKPYLFVDSNVITYGDSYPEYFKNHKNKEVTLEEILNFKNMKNQTFTITAEQAQSIIDIACGAWKPKLADKWAVNIALKKNVEIDGSFYKEMRLACTEPQHKLFDTIFGAENKMPTTIKEVLKFHGIDESDTRLKYPSLKMELIISSIRGGEVVKFDGDTKFFYVWWNMVENRFGDSSWASYFSFVSARMCFNSDEQAKHAMKYFEKEYRE